MAPRPPAGGRPLWVAACLALTVLVASVAGPGADAGVSGDGSRSVVTPQTDRATPTTAATTRPNGSTEFPRRRVERLVHRFVNRERTERGLDPLALNDTLSRIARYHSRDMADRGYFGHVSPANETMADRYDRFGFECRAPINESRYATGAENIAYTYYEAPVDRGDRTVVHSTPKQLARAVVGGWMNSSVHREHILAPHWRREGVGVTAVETPNGTRAYVTQNFC